MNNISNGQSVDVSDNAVHVLLEDLLKKGVDLRVRVTGRSMAPFLNSGDLVVMRKVPFRTLGTGDLIFFKTNQDRCYIHRIIQKTARGNQWLFQTKGDAKRSMDETIPGKNILGKVLAVEKVNPFAQSHSVLDLESPLWRSVSFLIAKTHFFNTRIFYGLHGIYMNPMGYPLQHMKRIWGRIL